MTEVPAAENSRDKLTIAHFLPWAGIGGTETATVRMMDITRERFRNVAFCLQDATALRQMCRSAGIETVVYAPPVPSLRHGLAFYRDSQRVAQQIREAKIDIVHFADLKAAYHNNLAAVLARVRRVSHFRVTYPKLSLRTRIALSPLDCYIFVSQAVRNSFGMSVPRRKARVLYDPVEPPAISPDARDSARKELGLPENCTVVGMVARVSPQKDYFTLAEAAALVLHRFPQTRFLVVGDNAEVELNRSHYREVLTRLNELGISDKFIFTGHTPDVPRWIASMDIAVLCTHREGFGLGAVEAMVLQKPVVATAVGGLLEVVDDGVTGYLHQWKNSQELADAIMDLIADPEKARSMGRAGYERARAKFSRRAFVEQLSATYAGLVRD